MRVVRTIASSSSTTVEMEPSASSRQWGRFHEGHLALFRAAREENDVVVVICS